MKLLIVEDELEIQELISRFFKNEGFLVETACTYAQAQEKLDLYEYECAIIDITLPDGNGLNLIREIKSRKLPVCIIVVSARNSIEDKISGLDAGADDYLAKPFSLAELNARIKSVLRRSRFGGSSDILFNELRIDTESRQFFVNGVELALTPKEYDLIVYFILNKNRVLSKESIVEHLWGDMMGINANSLDLIYTHIRNLRHKIVQAGGKDYIKSIYSIGYKFCES